MSTNTALAEFIGVWSDDLLLTQLGERLTCHEADALADLLRAEGEEGAADCLLAAHGRGDNEDDSHYQARCDADALHGTGFGICDQPLDEHGNCPHASRHVTTLDKARVYGLGF